MGQAQPMDGPRGLPYLGSFIRFVRDPHGFYDRLREYDEPVVGYTMFGYDMCSVLDPDAIETVLMDDTGDFPKPEMMGDALGEYLAEGLLLTEGERWRDQRTMLQPMFYRGRIETYADLMADYSATAANEWAGEDRLNLQVAMKDLTLRILARTLFDVDVEAYEGEIRDVADAISEIGRAGSLETQVPSWVPLPSRRRHRRAFSAFSDAMREVIADSRTEMAGNADSDRDDILSLLLDAEYPDGTPPSDAEIRDQLMTFLFAGHETTALALTWMFVLLNERPETYDRLREEVDAVLDSDHATLDDLPDLTYTDRVIRESLRIRPPANALFREAATDTVLAGVEIPEGTFLVLPQFAVQTDPRYFDDPETFRPDRWDGDLEDEIPDYAYFPFGGGPRHCIGMRFANLELRLALTTIVKNVDIDVHNPGVDPDMGTPYKPKDDVTASIETR